MQWAKYILNNTYLRPLITTIIPTYRRPKMLQRAIRSVLNQTYPNFQVCVYDNASCDETGEIVAEFAKKDQRVKYHCHPENIGAFKNFLYGMEHVETPFFTFLSDDDILLPDFYKIAIDGFERFKDALFSAGSTIAMTDKGEVLYALLTLWQREGYYAPPEGLFEMLEGKPPTWSAIIFRKEVITQVGVLDGDTCPPSDLDFVLRAAARFPFVISQKPCAIFVRHSLSFCTMADSYFLWPSWRKITRNLTEDKRIPLNVRVRADYLLTEWIKRMLFSFGVSAIKRKDYKDVYRISAILYYDYHLKVKPLILCVTVWLREYLPLGYSFMNFFNKIRRFFRANKYKRKSQQLQERLGEYARFLEV